MLSRLGIVVRADKRAVPEPGPDEHQLGSRYSIDQNCRQKPQRVEQSEPERCSVQTNREESRRQMGSSSGKEPRRSTLRKRRAEYRSPMGRGLRLDRFPKADWNQPQ